MSQETVVLIASAVSILLLMAEAAVNRKLGWRIKLVRLWFRLVKLFKRSKTMAELGHPINHLDDPGACISVVVDKSKELPERICAGLDLVHWGTRTFLPHRESKNASFSSCSEEELLKKLDEATAPTEGVAAVDWSKVWSDYIKPIIYELLKRWIFS